MGIRTRNAQSIIAKEAELFKQIGMVKVGFEGVEPSFDTGGDVWYIASFPNNPEQFFTIRFSSWFGHIRLTHMRLLNPRLGDGT